MTVLVEWNSSIAMNQTIWSLPSMYSTYWAGIFSSYWKTKWYLVITKNDFTSRLNLNFDPNPIKNLNLKTKIDSFVNHHGLFIRFSSMHSRILKSVDLVSQIKSSSGVQTLFLCRPELYGKFLKNTSRWLQHKVVFFHTANENANLTFAVTDHIIQAICILNGNIKYFT